MRSDYTYMQRVFSNFRPVLEKAAKVKDWRYRYF
jgi:hypothetical protein